MRSLVLAFSLLLAMAGSVSAKVFWWGEAIVVAAPGSECFEGGHFVGNNVRAVFQPSGLSDNGADSWLSFVGTFHGASLRVVNNRPGPGKTYTGVRIYISGDHVTGVTGGFKSFVMTPATITETSRTIFIRTGITNWLATVGCTATIEASFVRQR